MFTFIESDFQWVKDYIINSKTGQTTDKEDTRLL